VERHTGEAHQHPPSSRHPAADIPAGTGHLPVPFVDDQVAKRLGLTGEARCCQARSGTDKSFGLGVIKDSQR